jgi:hypothetical protein
MTATKKRPKKRTADQIEAEIYRRIIEPEQKTVRARRLKRFGRAFLTSDT